MKPDRALHELAEERALPTGDAGLFAWHRARYEFALPLVAGKRVLDVGCGEGYGAALLAERAREVVGVDYSPAAIEHARAAYRAPNLRFERMDATALEPELGTFDVVTCFEVIEHLADDEALLAGIARVLAPGGSLVLSTPNALVDELFEAVGGHEHYAYHVNMLAPGALRRRVRAHFRDVRLYGQSVRRSGLHAALKTLDVLNLRHRLVRSRRVQASLVDALAASAPGASLDFRFSRVLVRQSPALLLVARR